MTHFLKYSLEIWDLFFIVILTSNDKSLRLAKYASMTSVTFGVLGTTLAQKLQKSVACALVTSHLDYCNSLLYNLPDRDTERLQRVQNCLARVVCKATRFSRSKPLLNFLHWLPVKYRIRFKLCTITLKAFLFHQPTYLFNYLVPLQNSRSSNTNMLIVPRFRTKWGSRAFAVAAPSTWNSLPVNLKTASRVTSFKKMLKTFLFDSAFPPPP